MPIKGRDVHRSLYLQFTSLLIPFALASCFSPSDVVVQRDPSLWSQQDCFTVLASTMRSNLSDRSSPNIKVIATPYTAAVVRAIGRISQLRHHWTEYEYRRQTDTLLAQSAGLYYDWIARFVINNGGNFVTDGGQLDSILFLVTIRNINWPCQAPTIAYPYWDPKQHGFSYVGIPAAQPTAWPCYDPDIGDLESRFLLENDRGDTVRPKFVWGRTNNRLRPEETVFVRFPLRQGGRYFLGDSKTMFLVLKGFDATLRLEFPVANLR